MPTTSLGVRARGFLILAILLAVTRGVAAAIPKEQLWHAVQSGTSYPVSLAPKFEDACNSIIDQWASFGYLGGSRIIVPRETVCRWLNVHRDGVDYGTLYFNMSNLPPACPANSGLVGDSCQCGLGYQEDPLQKSCLRASPEPPSKVSGGNACPAGSAVGHPLLPATGEKYRDELDYADSSPDALSFTRTYRSTWASDSSHTSTGMGQVWTHNHGSVLKATPSTTPNAIIITSAEGYVHTFVLPTGSSNWSATNSADTLLQATDGGWTYRRANDNSTLTFDTSGKLLSASARNGWTRTYAYSASGQLATISNGFGRSLTLAYNGSGQLITVTTPDARMIGYAYDSAGRLSVVTYPDGKGNVLSQAITDTASSPNTTRTWNWTWNAQGLAATETAPKAFGTGTSGSPGIASSLSMRSSSCPIQIAPSLGQARGNGTSLVPWKMPIATSTVVNQRMFKTRATECELVLCQTVIGLLFVQTAPMVARQSKFRGLMADVRDTRCVTAYNPLEDE